MKVEPQVKPATRPRAVYCFFDNTDEKPRAPADAKTLMSKLGLRWQVTVSSTRLRSRAMAGP